MFDREKEIEKANRELLTLFLILCAAGGSYILMDDRSGRHHDRLIIVMVIIPIIMALRYAAVRWTLRKK